MADKMADIDTRPRRGSRFHLAGAFELFGQSREMVMDNISVFAILYIIPLIFTAHTWIWAPTPGQHVHFWNYRNFSYSFYSNSSPSFVFYSAIGFSIFWFLFVLLAGSIFQIMTLDAQLRVAKDRSLQFEKLWGTVKELGWRLVGLYLLILVYVVVGLILFIVPGLIMLRRYFLAPYVMLDKKTGIRETMDLSAAITKPYSGSVWRIIGVFFLISLTNVIPYIGGAVAFILAALYSIAPALRYQELKNLPH